MLSSPRPVPSQSPLVLFVCVLLVTGIVARALYGRLGAGDLFGYAAIAAGAALLWRGWGRLRSQPPRRMAYLWHHRRPSIAWPVHRVFRWLYTHGAVGAYGPIELVDMTPDENETGAFLESTRGALRLMEEHDPRRFRRLSPEVRFIVNVRQKGSAGYVRAQRACAVDFGKLRRRWPEASQQPLLEVWYAALLVHEGTHGLLHRLGFPYSPRTRERIEWICTVEQWRFLARLPVEEYPFVPDFMDRVADFDPERWRAGWEVSRWQRVREAITGR